MLTIGIFQKSVLNTIIQGWFVRPVKAEIKARDVRNCFNRGRPAAFLLELEQIAPAMSEVCLEVIVTQGGSSISADNKHSIVKLSLSSNSQCFHYPPPTTSFKLSF